jgi:2-keto-4-pentenoate hydratase
MDPERASQAAEIIWQAWRQGRRIDSLPDSCRPDTIEEGYDVQQALAAHTGEPVLGWKIAATSAAGQAHLDVSAPFGGRLYECFCYTGGAVLPADGLHMRVVEAEFAFRLADDLPPRGHDYDVDEVLARVDALHLAVEIPDSRFENFAAVGAPQLVAENACAGLFVLGDVVPAWRALDLAAQPVSLSVNGAVAGQGVGANVLGDPRLALTWLANDRIARDEPLRAEQIVTTGTCLQPVAIGAGDEVVADFGALGRVELRFAE